MTPRIPLRICRDCPHYRGYCPLTDLDPCPQADLAEDLRLRNRLGWAATLLVALLCAALLLSSCRRAPEPQPIVPKWSAVELLRQQHKDELTPWQELQMAIIFTESRCNPAALGANQDAGLYQLTPIYVQELNRVAGTDYTHADAFDPDKAVEMFNALQDHYNPGHDLDKAVYHHNKGEAYRRAVLDNLAFVRRYEAARKAVTK